MFKKRLHCCHLRMKFYLMLFFLFSVVLSFAQQKINVSGTVTSDKNLPLPDASVKVAGGSIGTITDNTGSFKLQVNKGATLIFSIIGYEEKRVKADEDGSILNVQLTELISTLGEVTVIAFGTQKKREVTGSVSQLNVSEVKDMPVGNIGQKLQGKFSGVQINQNSGQPGSPMTFRIRGAASINAGNSPLFVIDGFPTESGLQSLSPDDIESVTVLKDASASSLYGARAANGVILVTTKQAKSGQKNIELSSYVGIASVSNRGKPDLMNAPEFAQYKKEYYEDAAIYEGYTGGVPAEYQNPSQYGQNDGTNWYDVLLRNALIQEYNLSLSSGVKDLKSVTNLNYNRQEGVMLNSVAQRFTVRTNNVYTASDKLTFGLNLAGTYQNRSVPTSDASLANPRNFIAQAFLMDPTLNYKNADGTYPLSFSPPGMFPNPNYYLVLTQIIHPVKDITGIANAFAEYRIIDGLKYKISLNVNTNNTIDRRFTPSTAQGGLGGAPPQPATGNYSTSSYLSWLAENTLNYRKQIKEKHNLEALAGYTAQKVSYQNSSIDGSQFPDDNIPWINVATTRIGTVGASEWSLLSLVGRINYNYNGKYLISLAYRRDGSSRFGSNAKWGDFPSVSVGWIVSDESFMKNIDKINLLKIRASYGKVGNNNIGNYTYLSSVVANNYVFNNAVTSGQRLGGIGNSNLTWETSTSYDLGLDLDLFNSRISFTYDYYKKKTNGLLYAIDIPYQSGFSSITSNIGRFDFWGHEFSVQTKNLTGQFSWNTNLNISFDRNIVRKLGTNDNPIGAYGLYWDNNRTAVGHPIGLFYGYINTGVYMTQEEFDTQPHGATSMVGTARFKDISGGPDGKPDGIIDANDRTFIGNPNPDFIYGMTNIVSYKNYDLSVVVAGTWGNDIADNSFQSTENLDGVFNVRKGVANRWRSLDNPGDGIYPRTRSGTTADFRNFTTRQVFNGTYLAVKNITIGYKFPIATNQYIKSARIYFSSQNTFIITKYPGMNPEAGAAGLDGLHQGNDDAAYPISKIFTLGVNVDF